MSMTGKELITFILENDLENKKIEIGDENQYDINLEEEMFEPHAGQFFFGNDWIRIKIPEKNKIVNMNITRDTFYHDSIEYVVVSKDEYDKLDYDKATSIGLWVSDKTPEEIMRTFLGNFESDVNPFPTESKEENNFLDQWDRFVKNIFWKIK